MSHLRFFRRSAAEGERSPAGWHSCHLSGVSVGSVRPRHPGKYDGRCLSPPTCTLLHTQTTTTISQHLFPLQFILDVCTSDCFKETNYKNNNNKLNNKCIMKKIQRFQLKIPKLQTAFVKLELHGIVLFL